MNKMADTVVKKKDMEEKAAAKRAVDQQLEKERLDAEKEKHDKAMRRKRDQDVLKTLDHQMEERRENKKMEK